MSNNTSDKIKNRLLKNASLLWGVQQAELSAFDPVVNMLFGSCSKEFEKIYNEQDASQARVLERLSKLLLPEVNAGAIPSHGILHGRPNEAVSVLSKNSQLFFRKNRPASESSYKENHFDIYFSPLSDVLLLDGKIKYSVSPYGMYEHRDVFFKEKVFGYENNTSNKHVCYLGIELNSGIENLEKLSIYFDWSSNSEKERLFDALPFVKASINGKEIPASIGFKMGNLNIKSEFVLNEGVDLLNNVESAIGTLYENRFVTLGLKSKKGGPNSIEKVKYPSHFSELFDPKNLDKLQSELVWVELKFPSYISDEVLDELVCTINAFPVCNKKLNELTFRIQSNFNVVPLGTEEDYLYNVQSVKSFNGQEYNTTKVSDTNKIENGEYVVRKGGVERFDHRNAKDLLNYLIDLLRDESASFALFGQEAISTNLLELNQQLAALEQKVKRGKAGEAANYIMVKPKLLKDNIFVEYWTAAGEKANNIRIGSKLQASSSVDIRADELVLLSNTTGGRDPLSQSEVLNNFKASLITRDRIVTVADIKVFCSKELKGQIKHISFEKKFEVSSKANGGFIKYFEIEIEPMHYDIYKDDEWQSISSILQSKIETKSSFILPLKVRIKNN
ncbi:MAG: hypothetical protein V4608_00505 [Bacteroidota bacterium]